MIFIGRNLDDDSDIHIDASKSRAVATCGKRGSGKSYTMGVLIEELFREDNVVILVVDPMGIFHTMSLPNHEQERTLWDWGESPEGLPIKALVPGDPIVRYGDREVVDRLKERGIVFEQLRLNPPISRPRHGAIYSISTSTNRWASRFTKWSALARKSMALTFIFRILLI